MKPAFSRIVPTILALSVVIAMPSAIAQVDQSEFDEAKANDVTIAIATTMRVESKSSELVVTGKHELLRATLLAFVRDQGLDGVRISFPKVQWPDGTQSDPNASGFTGELRNGSFRFILDIANVAIVADDEMEAAVDQMFKTAHITIFSSVKTGSEQPQR